MRFSRYIIVYWPVIYCMLIALSLVGCLAGVVASIIDIGAQWMTDLRYGICGGSSHGSNDGPQLWFNREQCCWAVEGDFDNLEDCDQWLTWSELIGKDFH